MAYDKQKVIDLATSQVGYHEKASNNSLDSFAANSGGNNLTRSEAFTITPKMDTHGVTSLWTGAS